MAETALQGRRKASSADDRTKRDNVFPKQNEPRSLPCEHDRPRADVSGGLCDRGRGRSVVARNAMAGDELLDDAALCADEIRNVELYSDAAGKIVLFKRACGAALPRRQLTRAEARPRGVSSVKPTKCPYPAFLFVALVVMRFPVLQRGDAESLFKCVKQVCFRLEIDELGDFGNLHVRFGEEQTDDG